MLLEIDDGDPEITRWWSRRSYGALAGWPVFSADLSYLMAEGRPKYFLPALMLKGRQCCFVLDSMVAHC